MYYFSVLTHPLLSPASGRGRLSAIKAETKEVAHTVRIYFTGKVCIFARRLNNKTTTL